MDSFTPNFTQRRLLKFAVEFKARMGTPPSLQDFEQAGFSRDLVEDCVRRESLEVFYVKLTSGTVVKTYRVRGPA